MTENTPATNAAAEDRKYSIDGEMYLFDEPGEALQALDDEDRLEVGAVYYSCAFEICDLDSYLSASDILERAEEVLYDDIGESAEDAFYASPTALEELDALLNDWAKKHLSGTYWRYVGKATEHRVTAEEIAERNAAKAGAA